MSRTRQNRWRLTTVGLAMALLLPLVAAPASAVEARDVEEGCPQKRVPDPGFSDVPEGGVHQLGIECIAWYGVTQGTSATKYSPELNITRGQMAAFIIRLLDYANVAINQNPPDYFDDDDNTLFEKQINQLADLGIVNGQPDTNDVDNDGDTEELVYLPGANVTRGAMAAFINRTVNEITGFFLAASEDFFTDDNGSTFEDDINGIAGVGIATGLTETTFGPNLPVTRGQMGSFLGRGIDYFVELGSFEPPIDGVMDIVLDQSQVKEGRAVTGSIFVVNDNAIESATVDICNGAFGSDIDINVTEQKTFSFTLPFGIVPDGSSLASCTLRFEIDPQFLAAETESHAIIVEEVQKVLDGPELVSISTVSETSSTITLRYLFNEELNPSVVAGNFHLYGFSGAQYGGTSAQRSGTNVNGVDVVFNISDYDAATSGGLARFAVQDLDGNANAEFGFGIKSVALSNGQTSAPDLISIAVSGSNVTFTFDEPAAGAAADEFHLLHNDGTVSDGLSIAANADETAFTIGFADVSGALRAYVDAGAVTSAAGTSNPLNAEDFPGAVQSNSPHLTGLVVDPTNNRVELIFSEAVSYDGACSAFEAVLGCADTAATIYDLNGDEFSSNDVTKLRSNTLAVTFSSGVVSDSVVGASIPTESSDGNAFADADADGDVALLDEVGRAVTFADGTTAAPDLIGVQKQISDTDVRYSFQFDQPFVIYDDFADQGEPAPTEDYTTPGDEGDFLLYLEDNSRLVINDECSVSGLEVICIFADDHDDYLFARNARYAAVSYAVVASRNLSTQQFPPTLPAPTHNREGGFQFDPAPPLPEPPAEA